MIMCNIWIHIPLITSTNGKEKENDSRNTAVPQMRLKASHLSKGQPNFGEVCNAKIHFHSSGICVTPDKVAEIWLLTRLCCHKTQTVDDNQDRLLGALKVKTYLNIPDASSSRLLPPLHEQAAKMTGKTPDGPGTPPPPSARPFWNPPSKIDQITC